MTSSEFSVIQPWQSNTRSAPRWVFSHVRRNWAIIAVILAGAIGNAGLAAAIPIFTGAAFDAVTGATPDLRTLALACVMLVVSQGVRSGLQLGRNFGSEVLGQRLERDARRELYGELLGKSMGFHDMHATGDVMARATNDVRELALMMAPGLNLVIGSAIFLVMPILVAPRYHPTLVIVPVVFAFGYLLAMWHYLRTLQPVTAAVRRTFGEMNARLTEAVEGIETVKGAAQEEREVALFDAQRHARARRHRGAGARRGALSAAAAAGRGNGRRLRAGALSLQRRRDHHRRGGGVHRADLALRLSGLHLALCLFAGGLRAVERAPHSGIDPLAGHRRSKRRRPRHVDAGRRAFRSGQLSVHAWRR
jgi:ABC-type multidrug transport system fused ATPase/permease subunit